MTSPAGPPPDSRELDIEKRWLMLARIDPQEFFRFYEKYYPRIYGFIYKRVLDHDLTEDLTSQTFLKAQGGLWRFRWQNVTFGAWLFRIALNEIRGHVRKTTGRSDRKLDEARHVADGGFDPMAQLLLSEEQRILYRLVLQLEELSREIFELHYWGNLTTRQISVVLGHPEGTIKTRLSRGRKQIASELQSRYPEIARELGPPLAPDPETRHGERKRDES